MESASQSEASRGVGTYLQSPTIILTLILIAVYLVVGLVVGDLGSPISTAENMPGSTGYSLVLSLMQCDTPLPIYPWTILTTIFLHAGILHIAGNLLFLLLFGFILEEQVTKSQWLATFFITGVVGSLSFVALDAVSSAVSGFPNPTSVDCAVGASGAVYGIMGTAVGLKVVIILIFLLGLNIFAGGGTPAHLGGLFAGLVLRRYWSLGKRPFRGI
jgi:membrane associated rhomboid family serine protease